MKPKPKIISIKCPNCQKRYMIQKIRLLKLRSFLQEKEWFCLDCPIWVWDQSWFDEFTQFEHLVERERQP